MSFSSKTVLTCSALGCKTNRRQSPDLCLFDFPKDEKRSKMWMTVIGRDDLLKRPLSFVSRNCKVCSLHFLDNMFRDNNRTSLRANAIPSLSLVTEDPLQSLDHDVENTSVDPLEIKDSIQICRACLGTFDLRDLFSSDIHNLFEDCTGIKLNPSDGLPQVICGNCVIFCNDWLEFKKQSEINDVFWMSTLSGHSISDQSIKEEPEEVIEVRSEMTDSDSDLFTDFYNIENDTSSYHAPSKSSSSEILAISEYEESCEEAPMSPQSTEAVPTTEPHKPTRSLCFHCGKTFKNNIRLSVHINHTHTTKVYTCDICCKQLKNQRTLYFHKITVHAATRSYVCTICNKGFKRKDALDIHMVRHLNNPEGLRTMKSDPKLNIKCKVCDHVSATVRQYDKHCYSAHSEDTEVDIDKLINSIRKFKCSHCPKRFVTANCRSIHQRQHTMRPNTFVCNFCGNCYQAKAQLDQHKRDAHASECDISELCDVKDDQFQCKICHKSFKIEQSLKNHIHLHRNFKRHQCSICSRRFHKTPALRLHMMTHNKSTTCDKCGQKFKLYVSFLNHKETCDGTRHSKRRQRSISLIIRKISCPICSTEYRCLKLLEAHVIDMHREDSVNLQEILESVKKYSCGYCEKRFSEHKLMKRHERRVHSEQSGHSCPCCDKVFKSATSLQYHYSYYHMKIDEGIDPEIEDQVLE